ncbi:hypothetical protein TL18_00675 [Methanobrevibacter sp. YE315]|uniref:DUF3800 domain-containing protein n=1 Tax=Methanobrevibacter sp. YE315 TaxID=1609968 RepID=UPI000764D5F6|nr:DUF3800 domain-containing protein [Methanobrevibacter sp. YE315]AMD16680.1 hypothetical protein TL18_00675 [Methanobrevibacter sp. YE315]
MNQEIWENKQKEIENFNEYFESKLNNYKKYPVIIKHANSMNYKGLQISDLIAWSIFQSVEYNNTEYIDLIKNKQIKEVYKE